MIYSIKNTIDAFMLANQFDQGEKFVNIDQIKLDEVYEWSFNKEHVSLEISEAVISNINEEDNEIQEE